MKHYKNHQVFPRIYVKKVLERTENREEQITVNINNRNEENKKKQLCFNVPVNLLIDLLIWQPGQNAECTSRTTVMQRRRLTRENIPGAPSRNHLF